MSVLILDLEVYEAIFDVEAPPTPIVSFFSGIAMEVSTADGGLNSNCASIDGTVYSYEDAKVSTLRILPPDFRYKELKSDYDSMRSMIFDKYLSFDEILSILKDLEKSINSLCIKS